MSNYKALGIEKDMQVEFSNYNKSELVQLIDSGYFEHPCISNRKSEAEYCEIEIIDCSYSNWWYKDLFGHKFFCRIRFSNYGRGRFISEFVGVKLTSKKEITFKTFSPSDVIII